MKSARPTKVKASALEQRRHSTAPAHQAHDCAPLVTLDQGEATTTSQLIAEKFGKRHADVLRAIENLECSHEFTERNFALSEYTDPTGRALPMYRVTRDGFAFLAMGFTGRAAAEWKERFIGAFNRIERELRRIASARALPEWQEARQIGKQDRRDLTDAVRALALRAHERGDSTTPVHLWMQAATKTITCALFEIEHNEPITGVRERLTARQLRRLAMAEDMFSRAIESNLDGDLHHKAIYEQAKVSLQTLAAATGGKDVPGVDRPRLQVLRHQAGRITPWTAYWLALVAACTAPVVLRWVA